MGTPRRIDAWIERNGKKRSRLSPFTPETTLGSICTGYESVVVANWNALRGQVSRNSSQGPTRDARRKPDVMAPGSKIEAARSNSANGTINKSGTSMAAPYVSGLAACLLQSISASGIQCENHHVRWILTGAATKDWNKECGYGLAVWEDIDNRWKKFLASKNDNTESEEYDLFSLDSIPSPDTSSFVDEESEPSS